MVSFPAPLRAVLALCVLALAILSLAWVNLHGYRRALEVFLIFVFLAYLATLARARLRDSLVVVSSLLLGLSAFEALAVRLEKTSFPVQGKGFSVSVPELGWGPARPGIYPARKSNPQTGAVIYDVKYTIDDALLRKTISQEDGPTIAFFGDSFTFGEGVNDGETMPQAFADLTGRKVRVLNLGFPGYGPQQFLRALELGTFDTLLGPKPNVFVFLTAPWHAERTACKPPWMMRAPRYRLENGRVTFDGTCTGTPSRLLKEFFENTALYRVAIAPYRQRIDQADTELYVKVLLAAVNLAKEKYGAATVIPYLPAGDEYLRGTGFSDAAIIDRLTDGGAIVIDASLAKEAAEGATIEIPGDGHPSPFANHARAQAIKDYFDQKQPSFILSGLR
jgi:hypothetical protein